MLSTKPLLCISHGNLMPEQTIMPHPHSFCSACSQAQNRMSCVRANSKRAGITNVNITVFVCQSWTLSQCSCQGFLSDEKLKLPVLERWYYSYLTNLLSLCRKNSCLPFWTHASQSIYYLSHSIARRWVGWLINSLKYQTCVVINWMYWKTFLMRTVDGILHNSAGLNQQPMCLRWEQAVHTGDIFPFFSTVINLL